MDRPAGSHLARSFERHMRAQNRSERTIATYLQGLRQAETFLRERPDRARCTDERERATLRPTTLEAATRADLEAFMAEVLARRAPSTAATYHKILKVLYAWLLDEQEMETDPMARMKPPTVPAKPVPIEAKASARREDIRMAIGQLFDYARYLSPRPRLAVLIPDRPTGELLKLLREHQILAIWRTSNGFTEFQGGRLGANTTRQRR